MTLPCKYVRIDVRFEFNQPRVCAYMHTLQQYKYVYYCKYVRIDVRLEFKTTSRICNILNFDLGGGLIWDQLILLIILILVGDVVEDVF
jgi:hypothetical protein